MKSSRRFAQLGLVGAFVLLASSVAALIAVPHVSKPVAIADVGTIAPDFQLNDNSGRAVSLSDFPGQAIVMFFCSGNSPSQATLDHHVDQLARNFASDGRVKFLAIDAEPASGSAIASPLQRPDRCFPTLKDVNGNVANRYSAKVPSVIIVGPHGQVCYRQSLADKPDALAQADDCANALQNLLESSTLAVASNGIQGH